MLTFFSVRILRLLRENLEAKAKKEKKEILSNFFLMNNLQYILNNVRKNNLLGMKDMNELVRDYESVINHQIALYRQNWSKALSHLLDVNKAPNSKEEDFSAIKKKFKSFTKDFEELGLKL